jgi:hypothetical protein
MAEFNCAIVADAPITLIYNDNCSLFVVNISKLHFVQNILAWQKEIFLCSKIMVMIMHDLPKIKLWYWY